MGGGGDERNIGNAEYEGGSPVNLEVDRTPYTYELDSQMCLCACVCETCLHAHGGNKRK